MKFFFSVIAALIVLFNTNSQDLPIVLKFQTENIDPSDLNLLKISSSFKKSLNQEKTKFAEGYIIIKSDTIKCKILTSCRGIELNPFLFTVAKYSDSLFVYTAREIERYYVKNELFHS